MCELMGICANMEVNPRFSFKEIKLRGGGSRSHTDGWGIGFYENSKAKIYKGPEAASRSSLAKEIETGKIDIKSRIFISHIRQALSAHKLENTHPFQTGKWIFAHNGAHGLDKYYKKHGSGKFKPKGDTGSEKGFCILMNVLEENNVEKINDKTKIIKAVSDDIRKSGAHFNFIMSDSEHLFCYYSGYNSLYFTKRSFGNNKITLEDADYKIKVSDMKREGEKAVIVATKPLTKDEEWEKFGEGELKVFVDGKEIKTSALRKIE